MFKSIVLGLDGSESSDQALQQTAILAKEQGSRVEVVHVLELTVGRGVGFPGQSEVGAKIERQTKELVNTGVDAELEVHSAPTGGPAHAIATAAARANADLIVIGTRGHSGTAGILLGSVAQRLLHLSPCPLLVIPPARSSYDAPEAELKAEPEVELSVDDLS